MLNIERGEGEVREMKKKTNLLVARVASGKTQRQVAQEAQINERAYQNYEYDENEPGIRTAIRIADALGVKDVRSLWGGNPMRT